MPRPCNYASGYAKPICISIPVEMKKYLVDNHLSPSKIFHDYLLKYTDCPKEEKIFIKTNKTKKIINKIAYLAYKKKGYYINYYSKNKIKRAKYISDLYCNNPIYKLNRLISRAVSRTLKNNGKIKNRAKWNNILGYDGKQVKIHLENQFTKGMSWKNQGKFWEIDHIVPLSWFPNFKQVIKHGWKLENLQPLEVKLNREKHNLYVGNPKSNLGIIYL